MPDTTSLLIQVLWKLATRREHGCGAAVGDGDQPAVYGRGGSEREWTWGGCAQHLASVGTAACRGPTARWALLSG